jgi:Clp amino terminal domain, pathogenicity island component
VYPARQLPKARLYASESIMIEGRTKSKKKAWSENLDIAICAAPAYAIRGGAREIETEHLLLAILRDGQGEVIPVLEMLNVDVDELGERVCSVIDSR